MNDTIRLFNFKQTNKQTYLNEFYCWIFFLNSFICKLQMFQIFCCFLFLLVIIIFFIKLLVFADNNLIKCPFSQSLLDNLYHLHSCMAGSHSQYNLLEGRRKKGYNRTWDNFTHLFLQVIFHSFSFIINEK